MYKVCLENMVCWTIYFSMVLRKWLIVLTWSSTKNKGTFINQFDWLHKFIAPLSCLFLHCHNFKMTLRVKPFMNGDPKCFHPVASSFSCIHVWNSFLCERFCERTCFETLSNQGSKQAVTHNTCYSSVMFDGPLMLWVNWTIVDTIHPYCNKFAAGVKIKVTGELKLLDRPGHMVTQRWQIVFLLLHIIIF